MVTKLVVIPEIVVVVSDAAIQGIVAEEETIPEIDQEEIAEVAIIDGATREVEDDDLI